MDLRDDFDKSINEIKEKGIIKTVADEFKSIPSDLKADLKDTAEKAKEGFRNVTQPFSNNTRSNISRESITKSLSDDQMESLITETEDLLNKNLASNNPFYTNREKAKDLVELERVADPTEIIIKYSTNLNDHRSLTIAKDNVPKSVEDLINSSVLIPPQSSDLLSSTKIARFGDVLTPDQRTSVDEKLRNIVKSQKDMREIDSKYISKMYTELGCSGKQILDLVRFQDMNLSLFEERCILNKLVTYDFLSGVATGFKEHLLNNKFSRQHEEVSLKQNYVKALFEQENIDFKELDIRLTDLKQSRDKLEERVIAYTNKVFQGAFTEYYFEVLKNDNLYTGNSIARAFQKLRANTALFVTSFKKQVSYEIKYNDSLAFLAKPIELALKLKDFLSHFFDKEKGQDKDSNTLKPEVVKPALDQAMKGISSLLSDGFKDKLAALNEYGFDSITDIITGGAGAIAFDESTRNKVNEKILHTAINVESALNRNLLEHSMFIMERSVDQNFTEKTVRNIVVEAIKTSNFTQDIINLKKPNGQQQIPYENSLAYIFTERKADTLIHAIMGEDKDISKENAKLISNFAMSSMRDREFSGENIEISKLFPELRKYEALIQYTEPFKEISKKYDELLKAKQEGRDYDFELTTLQKYIREVVTNADTHIHNEQLVLSAFIPISETIFDIKTVMSFVISSINPAAFAVFAADKAFNSKTLNYVSLDYEGLESMINSAVDPNERFGDGKLARILDYIKN